MSSAGNRESEHFVPPAPRPGDRDPSYVTLTLRMMRSQIEGWPRAVFEQDVWAPPFPGMPIFVMSPDAVRTVLHDEADHFSQGALFRRMMRPAWGTGMLTAQGNEWRQQRQAASKPFRPVAMPSLAPFFARVAEASLQRWAGQQQYPIDIEAEMKRLTFDIILDTMLSGAEDFERTLMSQRIEQLFTRIGRLHLSYFFASDRYHENRPGETAPERDLLLADIKRMIARRRTAPARGDLVDLLMQTTDPQTGEGWSDALLADNILGFIIAGHETSAVTLTWALYLVAAHRATGERIRAEVCSVAGTGMIAADHIPQLIFTKQVIQEAMRLYPPGFLLTRVAGRNTTLAGHPVRAGQRVNIPIYAIHRRSAAFPYPHAFNPDRFAPDQPAPDRYAYFPFGAGPRVCLGAAFAMTELVTVLGTLVRGAEFEPPPAADVWPIATLSIHPRGGLKMRVQVWN